MSKQNDWKIRIDVPPMVRYLRNNMHRYIGRKFKFKKLKEDYVYAMKQHSFKQTDKQDLYDFCLFAGVEYMHEGRTMEFKPHAARDWSKIYFPYFPEEGQLLLVDYTDKGNPFKDIQEAPVYPVDKLTPLEYAKWFRVIDMRDLFQSLENGLPLASVVRVNKIPAQTNHNDMYIIHVYSYDNPFKNI